MTRVLYWNINNFSLPKIQVAAPPPAAADAAARLNLIVQEIMRGPAGGAIPDIIVVVEVYSRVREVGAEGAVLGAGTNAGQAVLLLLAQIRADATLGTVAAGSNWCVVPPINVGEFGQREAVAVYYNAVNLQFTGPNLLYQLYGPPPPGMNVGQSQPINANTHAAITTYSPAWTAAMPAGRNSNFMIGGGMVAINENQLAGEWQYYMPGTVRPIPSPIPPAVPPNRLQFPNQGCRAPFLTRFQEVAGLGRTINLFSVHTSPSSARQAVGQMQHIQQMTAVAAGEVNVVLGDFNIDTFGLTWGNFNWMMPPAGIYRCELDPRAGHAGAIVPARKPYCMTHLLPIDDATPFNNTGVATDPQHNVYPRFGFMGSAWPAINDSGAIDNIFTAYGGGAAVGPAANITVVNTLCGTPYTFLGAGTPAGVTAELTGGLNYPSRLAFNTLSAVPFGDVGTGGVNSTGMFAPALEAIFQQMNNYGLVYKTSDHLPLMIDI